MQRVTADWEETNRSLFTRKAEIIVTIERADGKTPFISGSDLISFSHIKNGDILSGTLTQDRIVFTARNSNNRLDYDAENDNDVYENARITVSEGFMNPQYTSYDGISGGVYYVSDVKRDSRNDRYQFTAQTILAFMTEKCKEEIFNATNAYTMASKVIAQAEQSKGVPQTTIVMICNQSLLEDVTVYLVEGTDNYSLAEVLQLIAASCGCILYVYRSGIIHIEKLGDVTEHYVMAHKFMYSPLSIEYAEKIGNVQIVSNHGRTTTGTDYEGDKIGGEKVATIPILNDLTCSEELMFYMYNNLTKGRRQFKAKVRFDPALDLYDLIVVPNGKDVSIAVITSISASYNGAWKADIQAKTFDSAQAILDLRICDIELLTIEQLEHIRIENLEPNTISDIDGDYMASLDGELAFWKGA